ncbi:hypothetical protein K435DRAFT_673863 [Dendrothele bispora CBS 962.96]|uniref:Carbohydrate esterase family 16 protein n=1 Tax=Dendrothele bispora (strain CBS 962.96) TaxID=1314807 RepID=A0A4S8LQQ5_DENBC|nr:hypothetical protein K435DRAFT_673863 [Dendrothele bispora CBS 962.96]
MKTPVLFFLGLLGSTVSSLLPLHPPVPRQDPNGGPERNDGIHLAVGPTCGPLGGSYADVNAGLVPQSFKTIVSFGDSYTDGGIDNGSALLPPVLIPPNTEAGGRSTNGPVWIEGVASDIGANLMDYAQWGACTDLSLWPSNPRKVDFLGQSGNFFTHHFFPFCVLLLITVQTFLGQNHTLDPDTTLYSIFFGINDYLASLIDGNHMPAAAQVILDQISILSSPPTNGKSFLVLDVYGRGITAPQGEAFKQQIYDGLSAFHSGNTTSGKPLNVAYVDFEAIWNGVLNGNPGYQAFGYTSPDQCTSCTEDCNQYGWCKDGEHHFYWIDG